MSAFHWFQIFKSNMTIRSWEEAFLQKDIGDAILKHLDEETSLACRLVCQSWRCVVNTNRKLWQRILRNTSLMQAVNERKILLVNSWVGKVTNINQEILVVVQVSNKQSLAFHSLNV